MQTKSEVRWVKWSRAVALVAAVTTCTISACDCGAASMWAPFGEAGNGGAVEPEASDDVDAASSNQSAPEGAGRPTMPRRGGQFAPSLARLAAGDRANAETLAQSSGCAECHGEIAEEWGDSMHRFASFNNPLYRVAFDRFVEDAGQKRGDFCAGCHDPVPMVAGETDATVEPENPNAHVGVTCTTCHGISDATMDGNGSYTLQTAEVPMPARDSADAEGIEAHRGRLRSLKERSNRACASCHRGFLSQATGHEVLIDGFNEVTPWRRSGWAGNPATRIDRGVPERDCVGCHMPKTQDGHRSHRFPGGHTTFAAMLGADDQLEAVRKLLSDAATIDVAALGLGEERTPVGYERGLFRLGGEASRDWQVKPGDRVWFDVVVRNVAGGHRFPGGQRDLRDTWVAATVETADGRRIAEAGVDHRQTGDDPTAHRLRAELLNPSAGRERTHSVAHFRAPAYDNTIPPRSSAVVRYAFRIPESLPNDAFPLKIRAELNHRRLIRSFMNEACDAAGTERGSAFLEQTRRQLGRAVEPCAEQPITGLASDDAELFQTRFAPGDNKPPFARWFDRSLGLQHHLSQRLDEAIESLDRTDQVIDGIVQMKGPTEETKSQRRMRAMVDFVRGQVFARQRRHEAAIAAFDAAEDNVGDHPAIFRGRGNAYANVWKYEEAAEAFARGAEMADDDRLHRRHAIALGSLGRYGGSLLAAQRGLALEPRDADLLRAQYLATRNLEVPETWRETAKRSYHRYQTDDRAAQLRAECSDESERCRRERLPVHTHEMEVD